jgi:hypothetical protein
LVHYLDVILKHITKSTNISSLLQSMLQQAMKIWCFSYVCIGL